MEAVPGMLATDGPSFIAPVVERYLLTTQQVIILTAGTLCFKLYRNGVLKYHSFQNAAGGGAAYKDNCLNYAAEMLTGDTIGIASSIAPDNSYGGPNSNVKFQKFS